MYSLRLTALLSIISLTLPAKASFAAHNGASLPPKPAPPMPSAIHDTLDQEYPGWTLAPASLLLRQEFKKHGERRSPSFVSGDFDHDGHIDYAIQIAISTPGQEEQFVVAFLARGESFEETILQSMGLDPAVYLWVLPASLADPAQVEASKIHSQEVLLVLGGPVGDTAYAYSGGKFHEISVPQDPKHPYLAVPRPPDEGQRVGEP